MSIRSIIKDWLSGGNKTKTKSSKAKTTTSSKGSSRSGSYSSPEGRQYIEDEKRRKRERLKAKQERTTNALAEISKRTDALSSGKKLPTTALDRELKSGKDRVIKKLSDKAKNAPSDPKVEAAKASKDARDKAHKEGRNLIKENLNKIKSDVEQERRDYHEATGHRYDVNEKGISKEEKARRRQAVKMNAYDLEQELFETERHPIAASFARGALSGTTLGLSELAIKNSKTRQENGAEEFYQSHKNPFAEGAGRFVGALVPYGGTASAFENLGARAVEKAAASEVGRRLGAESLSRIMASEGARAAIARSLVGDAIQDSTVGLFDTAIDIAQRDDLETREDYAKALLQGQALNYGMGLAGNAAMHGLPIAGNAIRNAWGNFADESRLLRAVPKDVAEAVAKSDPNMPPPFEPEAPAKASDGKVMTEAEKAKARKQASKEKNKKKKLAKEEEAKKLQEEEDALKEKLKSSKNKEGVIASGKNWRNGEELSYWKAGDNLYVGNPKGEYKSFGKDLPENRVKAEDEFDNLNNKRQQQFKTEREKAEAGKKQSKPKKESNPRPKNVRQFTKKQLEELKRTHKLGTLSKAEYDYYFPKEEIKLTFDDSEDAVEEAVEATAAKGVKSKEAETKLDEIKAEDSDTKILTKKTLEKKLKRANKKLDELEAEIKNSSNSSQYTQDKLSSDYQKALERKKRVEAQIKEAEESADGTITVKKRKSNKSKPEVDESNVTVTKGKEELVEAQEQTKKGKKANSKKSKTETDTEVKLVDEDKKASKSIKSLENKIENANKNIKRFEDQLKEKRKNGASEKSIKYTQDQRAAEMKKRKDLQRELDELNNATEATAKAGAETKVQKGKALKENADVKPPEEKLSKAAQAREAKEAAKKKLDDLLDKAEKLQTKYEEGDSSALKELVETENEAKQAFREAGMSRSDTYRESKKLFADHEKALKNLEKGEKAKAPKPKAEPAKAVDDDVIPFTAETEPKAADVKGKKDNLEYYKERRRAEVEQAKAEEQYTVKTEGKKYSAVNESIPVDEASTRTTRETPKFTPKEEKAKGKNKGKGKKTKEAAEKLNKKQDKFRRNPSPRGEGLHKNVVEDVTGEKLDEAINPPTYKDYLEAKKTYTAGQASGEKEVVSRAGTSLMNATTADAQREFLEKGWRDGNFNYTKIKNKQKYEEVMRRWVNNPQAVAEDIIRYDKDLSQLSVDLMRDTHYQAHCVMKMLRKELDNKKLTEAELESVREIYGAAASLSQKLSSISGQVNQFQGVMVHCSPAKRSDNALDNIVDMLDSSRGFRKKARVEVDGKTVKLSDDEVTRRNQIRSMLLDNEDIQKTLEKVYNASTEEEYGEAMSELLLSSHKLDYATGFDYIQQWRYLSMLGNPKTHIRNMVGNVTFGALRNMSNTVRSVEENILGGFAEKHGLEIDYHGGFSRSAHKMARNKKLATDEASKAAWASFEKHEKQILGTQKYDSPQMAEFFHGLSELNTKLLGKEDDLFRAPAYREQYIKSYRKFAKKGEITDAILERIHNEALHESQVATFNEFNELAQILAKSQRGLYDANATTGQRALGLASNALLPFTKVPANILKQSVNYSPIGALKGLAHIRDAAMSGDSALFNKALDELASGFTGTGIAVLGFMLGKHTDIFTTNAGSEDAAAKFKKQQGVQNYSATVNLPNGKTYSVTLDWLVPASCTFFTGVEIANQLKSGFSGTSFWDGISNLSQVTARVIDPVLETSMLSSIYNITENARKSSSYDDQQSFAGIAVRELVQSYVSSFIPTFAGQIARTAYSADKMVVGESDPDYWINSLKVKMGLANTDLFGQEALGDDVNAYGEVKNQKDGSVGSYAKSFLKNAVIPANIQEVKLSDLDKQKIKEYEDYVENGGDPADKEYLFPKKSYRKNFTVGKEGADPLEVKLTNKQVSLYNQAKTTGGEEGMRVALEGIMFNRYEKDSKGKRTILKNGYTAEQKEALINQFKGKSLREVEEWLYKQPQFKSASEEEKRKVLNAMWNYSQGGKSQGAKRLGEQAVIKDQGGDVNEYNFKNEISKTKQLALEPYIADGTLTYEEAVDFARYAGKTYYYENDEGGSANTYYNKKQMMDYLVSKGYSYEKAEALYNSFKQSNAKNYNGSYSSGRRYGGYRRRGGRGGSSKPAKVPSPKKISASSLVKGKALVSKRSSSSSAANNVTLKRVQAKIDLPTAKSKR